MGCLRDFVSQRNGQGAEQEGDVNDGLPHQYFLVVVGGVDEGLEQMDRRNTNDGHAQLDLQDGCVHVAQSFGLIGVIF